MAARSCEQSGCPWIVHWKRTKWTFCVLHIFPQKAFDCVDHNKVWKILKEMRIPDHLACLLRNLYAGQEATVRTGHETMDCFKIRKGICQGCMLSACLFNLYAEYIMQNAGLDEAQAGIKTAGRNINNFRYAEELKSLLSRMKEESGKAGLKCNIQKGKIMASSAITSWQIDGKKWKQWQILFSWAPKWLQMVTAAMKLKDLGTKAVTNLDSVLKSRDVSLPKELDHKEGWALKNCCLWTVVLEKTLESPLDCKEI